MRLLVVRWNVTGDGPTAEKTCTGWPDGTDGAAPLLGPEWGCGAANADAAPLAFSGGETGVCRDEDVRPPALEADPARTPSCAFDIRACRRRPLNRVALRPTRARSASSFDWYNTNA
jgi:hypothetical protein